MGQTENDVLRKVSQWLAAQPEIRLAVVYGSFAKGNPRAESDLDIGLASEQTLTLDQKLSWADALSKVSGREVDLIDLRSATGTVLAEALIHGQLVKSADYTLFAQVLKRMWFDHEDFEKQRQRILAERRKKVLNG